VHTTQTFCRICHAACPIEVDVDAGRITNVRGVPADPLFEGYTCIKGRQLTDQLRHPARLLGAQRRAPGGHFEQIGSAAALDEIADRLRATIERHGPASVAVYVGTGGYQSSCSVAVSRAWLKGFGSRSFYTSLTIDQPAKAMVPPLMGMWEAGFHGYRDADVLMAVGYNPLVSSFGPAHGLQGTNPFVELRRAKQRGMALVVVDPRCTELATFADVHLQVRPGEDPALLAGMLRIVLEEGWFDAAFCERWSDGLDELAAAVEPFDLGSVAERCDVPAADVVAATRLFAEARRGAAGTGTGPSMAPHSSLTEYLVTALNIVCGRVNRAGDRLGAGWFLYPEAPRKAQVIAPRDPSRGRQHRVVDLRGFGGPGPLAGGEMLTSALAEEILAPGDGQVRAVVVNGGNPAVAWPDQALTMRALRDLELLVVIDHRMTPTAAVADYVLAPKLSLERADVPHLMDMWFPAPYTNYTEAVVPPAGDVLAEWEVFAGLARRMETPIQLPGGDLSAVDDPDDDHVLELVYAGSRMPIDEVRHARGVIHEDRALVVQPADPDCQARFALAPAMFTAELDAVREEGTSAQVLAPGRAGEYPFRLVSRRLKHVLNSLGTELPGLRAKGTTNHAYMHPADLEEIGVVPGELVDIVSPHGSIAAVAAAAPDVKRGVVSMAHSWGDASMDDAKVRDIGAPTNRLVTTAVGRDPITGMAVQSAIPVAVTKREERS